MIEKVLCIGLPQRPDRRAHARRELARVGLDPVIWIDAFGPGSPQLQAAWDTGRVAEYPPCFRCGRDSCSCENKRLIEPQVGAWLSHCAAWDHVQGAGLTLICEDDVKFTDRFAQGLVWLSSDTVLRAALQAQRPVLIRLGRALTESHRSKLAFKLTAEQTMANPCYAVNLAMARLLLASSERIHTTVDIYTHRQIAPQGEAFTLEPPIAYELSWSTGELRSDILPKQVYIDTLKQQLADLDPASESYAQVLAEIRTEEERFRHFGELMDGAARRP